MHLFLKILSVMEHSVDSDQTAPSGSGSPFCHFGVQNFRTLYVLVQPFEFSCSMNFLKVVHPF